MKVAVTLFGKNKKSINSIIEKFDFLIKNTQTLYCVLLFSAGIIYFLSSFSMSSFILKIGTNLFVEEEKKLQIADVIGVFALYNEKNYIFTEEKNENKILCLSI